MRSAPGNVQQAHLCSSGAAAQCGMQARENSACGAHLLRTQERHHAMHAANALCSIHLRAQDRHNVDAAAESAAHATQPVPTTAAASLHLAQSALH